MILFPIFFPINLSADTITNSIRNSYGEVYEEIIFFNKNKKKMETIASRSCFISRSSALESIVFTSENSEAGRNCCEVRLAEGDAREKRVSPWRTGSFVVHEQYETFSRLLTLAPFQFFFLFFSSICFFFLSMSHIDSLSFSDEPSSPRKPFGNSIRRTGDETLSRTRWGYFLPRIRADVRKVCCFTTGEEKKDRS